jgi:hypothetical protein
MLYLASVEITALARPAVRRVSFVDFKTGHLIHGCPFIYSQQRGTVGGITDLADSEPDLDEIELLEIQYWSGNPVGSGVGFRQEGGTLNTGIA